MESIGVAGAFRSICGLCLSWPICCSPAALVKPAGFVAGAVPDLHVKIIFFSTPTPTRHGPFIFDRHHRRVLKRYFGRLEESPPHSRPGLRPVMSSRISPAMSLPFDQPWCNRIPSLWAVGRVLVSDSPIGDEAAAGTAGALKAPRSRYLPLMICRKRSPASLGLPCWTQGCAHMGSLKGAEKRRLRVSLVPDG